MRKFVAVVILTGVVASGLTGCAPPEKMAQTAETITATPEELMALWREIPKAGIERMDVKTATLIAHGLSQIGPGGLDPIIDVLASPESEGPAKVLAVISLTPVLTEEMLPRLMTLTEAGNDTTTRCCAIDLVGLFQASEAEARMLALLEDDNHRVRTEATIMLLRRGHETGLTTVEAIWDHLETTDLHRTQIVLQIPETAYAQLERIFLEAVVNPKVEAPARQRAAELIGRHGGLAGAEALKQCAERDEVEEIRDIAAAGVEAIASRSGVVETESTPRPEAE